MMSYVLFNAAHTIMYASKEALTCASKEVTLKYLRSVNKKGVDAFGTCGINETSHIGDGLIMKGVRGIVAHSEPYQHPAIHHVAIDGKVIQESELSKFCGFMIPYSYPMVRYWTKIQEEMPA